MTPRPSITRSQRPLSAIFIGSLGSTSTSTPPDLPKLPEPPSPEGSPSPEPSGSGLPSPPATNSTGSGSGSGSNGDDSTNAGSLRRRTSTSQRPHTVSEMYSSVQHSRSFSDLNGARPSTLSDDEDEPNDHERDEDSTARYDLHRRRSTNTVPSDHASALQRVKSLTERNRMVSSRPPLSVSVLSDLGAWAYFTIPRIPRLQILDKLSSMSRHNSPVPTKPARSSVSPSHTPSPTPETSSRTTIRHATLPSRSASVSHARSRLLAHNHVNSGSETERESSRSRQLSQEPSPSDSMSNTPTSQHSEVILPVFNGSTRSKRISAPPSPGKGRSTRVLDREQSPPPTAGPSKVRTPRKRTSMAITASEMERFNQENGGEDDVLNAALAAVASTRRSRSPSVGASSVSRRGLNRNPLPREFRESESHVCVHCHTSGVSSLMLNVDSGPRRNRHLFTSSRSLLLQSSSFSIAFCPKFRLTAWSATHREQQPFSTTSGCVRANVDSSGVDPEAPNKVALGRLDRVWLPCGRRSGNA